MESARGRGGSVAWEWGRRSADLGAGAPGVACGACAIRVAAEVLAAQRGGGWAGGAALSGFVASVMAVRGGRFHGVGVGGGFGRRRGVSLGAVELRQWCLAVRGWLEGEGGTVRDRVGESFLAGSWGFRRYRGGRWVWGPWVAARYAGLRGRPGL